MDDLSKSAWGPKIPLLGGALALRVHLGFQVDTTINHFQLKLVSSARVGNKKSTFLLIGH